MFKKTEKIQMERSMRKVIAPTLCLVAAIILNSGCATVERSAASGDMHLNRHGTVAPENALVCIGREPRMRLGFDHRLWDCGDGIQYDSKIIRKADIHVTFVTPKNVMVEFVPGSPSPVPVNGELAHSVLYTLARNGEISYENVWGQTTRQPNGRIKMVVSQSTSHSSSQALIKSLTADVTSAVNAFSDNARFVCNMKNGGFTMYERPPGIMRLRSTTVVSGSEFYAPDFRLEAGKKYFVNYHGFLSDISIHERP